MIVELLSLFVFWGAIALLFYSYLGFPLLLFVRSLFLRRQVRRGSDLPSISVIIAAHNEATTIVQRLRNIFSLDYPRRKLEVIVISDGSDDETEQLVAKFHSPDRPVKLLALPRRGKNYALNAGVASAAGDILLFTDADTIMAVDALKLLVAPFDDPEVGGVGGDYCYPKNGVELEGERSYWNYDRLIKLLESSAGSMTSATGQIYALRRNLFNPIPEGVTDDFYESVQAPFHHKRLIFEPRAIAFGPIAPSAIIEFHRKVRNITNGLNGVVKMRRLLNPFEYGFYAIQLFSHKVLRRIMVFPLLAMLVSTAALWQHGLFYRAMFVLQLAFYVCGWISFAFRNRLPGFLKHLQLPFFFQMVNAAALVSVYQLFRKRQTDRWSPQRASRLRPAGQADATSDQ